MKALALRNLGTLRLKGSCLYSIHAKIEQFDLKKRRPGEVIDETLKDRQPVTESLLSFMPNAFSEAYFRFAMTPIDLRNEKIASWWRKKVYSTDIDRQKSYFESAKELLGNELALGKLITAMGGSVRYAGKSWMVLEDTKHSFPKQKEQGWILEGIDVSGLPLYYEGFEYFQYGSKVKSLNVSNCSHFNDWCIDLITGVLPHLETLDLSNCTEITWRGLHVIHRLRKLNVLKIGGIPALEHYESKLVCIELTDINPNLRIEGLNYLQV